MLKTVTPVADGCGEHATPGRMSLTLSSSDGVTTRTRSDFPDMIFLNPDNEFRMAGKFHEWEWRVAGTNAGAWEPAKIGVAQAFYPPRIGENLYEVRPKAGAHIWSTTAEQGGAPGQLVVQTLKAIPVANATSSGLAYFLFMGGKGCARVGLAGERLSGNQ